MPKGTTKSSVKKNQKPKTKSPKVKTPKTKKQKAPEPNQALVQEVAVIEAAAKKRKKEVPEVIPFQKMDFKQQMDRLFDTLPSAETGEQVKAGEDSTVADAVMPKPAVAKEEDVTYETIKTPRGGEFRMYGKKKK